MSLDLINFMNINFKIVSITASTNAASCLVALNKKTESGLAI